jgi:hypothetical protein
MIQRIQTVFLLVAIAINAALFNFSLAEIQYEGVFNDFTMMGLLDRGTGEYLYTNWLISGLAISTILVALFAIFLFRKRSVQIKITQLALFFQTAFVTSIFYFVDRLRTELAQSQELVAEKIEIIYSSGSWLSLFPFVFIFLAIRAISKDEKLIKAADRLR